MTDTSQQESDPEPEPAQPAELQVDVTTEDDDLSWLQSIVTLISQRTAETDPSPRVQFALDMMFVAA